MHQEMSKEQERRHKPLFFLVEIKVTELGSRIRRPGLKSPLCY